MGHRRRQMLGETRLLMEYLAEAYPDDRWLTNVKVGTDLKPRVGLALSEEERRMFKVYQRFPDAVVVRPHELVVIEATIARSPEKVGRLLEYLLIVPHTAELKPFLDRPIVGELVTAQADGVAAMLAQRQGMRYVVFAPPWLEEFYAIHPGRHRRAPAPGTIAL